MSEYDINARWNADVLYGRCEDLERQLRRLATDAIAALSAAGISTPAEGYIEAPWCLSGDIQKLARRNVDAELLAALERVIAEATAPSDPDAERWDHDIAKPWHWLQEVVARARGGR